MTVVIVGAAETEHIGMLPAMSALALHADAARRAVTDAGLEMGDIDGLACSIVSPVETAHYLGIEPTWLEGTNVGGSSPILHIRHAIAALETGLCRAVLIAHGESGRSRVGMPAIASSPSSLRGMYDEPYGVTKPVMGFALAAQAYMSRFSVTIETLSEVAVVQREWAARNTRAYLRDPISVSDVMESPTIAEPLHRLHCCLVTDGGGAIVLTKTDSGLVHAGRGRNVAILGGGEASQSHVISGLGDFFRSDAFRRSGQRAFAEAGMSPAEIDHAMLYDAFVHVPVFALEALGFVRYGEGADFIADRCTAPDGPLPVNTNGGGLAYTHTGQYGIFAVLESVRQLRGEADAQVHSVETSLVHANGGVFNSSGTLILGRVD